MSEARSTGMTLVDLIRAGLVILDYDYDAYYYTDTGEWYENKCDDPHCMYCVNRPEKHKD